LYILSAADVAPSIGLEAISTIRLQCAKLCNSGRPCLGTDKGAAAAALPLDGKAVADGVLMFSPSYLIFLFFSSFF
jgi:hypothetical protein